MEAVTNFVLKLAAKIKGQRGRNNFLSIPCKLSGEECRPAAKKG